MPLRPIEDLIPCQHCGNDDPERFEKIPWSSIKSTTQDTRFKETSIPEASLPGNFWVCLECGKLPNLSDGIEDLTIDDIMDA